MPAYIRRYPFLLARLSPESDELWLCFDPTSGAVGEGKDGEPLFDGDQPSDATKAILEFCEQFETAGQRTRRSWKSSRVGPADGRRGRDPARGLRAAVRLPWVPDGRREKCANCAATSCAR